MNTHRVLGALCAVLGAWVAPKSEAITYDLNTTPVVSINTIYGTAIFTSVFDKTGTGTLQPFLSLQGSPTEQGFNISQGDLDTKRNGQYTRTVQMSQLLATTFQGVDYFTFVLDVNEAGSTPGISLDALRIYTSSSNQPLITSLGGLASSGALRFDLDAGGDNTLLYTDSSSGSGMGDIKIFIPVSAFAGTLPSDYFYMYQQFGNAGPDSNSDSGFEETKSVGDFTPIPETSPLLPLLAVLGVIVAGPVVRRMFPA